MTEQQFIRAIDDLLSRHRRSIQKLEAVKRGDRKLKKVEVKGYRVRSYRVRPHVRYL